MLTSCEAPWRITLQLSPIAKIYLQNIVKAGFDFAATLQKSSFSIATEQHRVRQSNKHDGKETTTAFPDISGKLRLNHDDHDHRGR